MSRPPAQSHAPNGALDMHGAASRFSCTLEELCP